MVKLNSKYIYARKKYKKIVGVNGQNKHIQRRTNKKLIKNLSDLSMN